MHRAIVFGPTISVSILVTSAFAAPAVFQELSVEKARSVGKEAGKLVIADATAEWCMPCKTMDATTWVDEKVVAWITANAVAVQFDVDKEPGLAKSLKVRAMPTIILFKDGVEFDRVVGLRQPEQLLVWLEGAKRGERQAKAADAGPEAVEKMDMQSRLSRARDLTEARRYDAATAEFLWLWDNIAKVEPAMIGVRGSFMAGYIETLTTRHKPAKEAFTVLRDNAEGRLREEPQNWDILDDWIVLNDILQDQDRTLAWIDGVKGDPANQATLERFSFRVERLLTERGRWSDLGLLYSDPLGPLNRQRVMLANIDAAMRGKDEAVANEMSRTTRERFRELDAALYGGLLAADRPNDAEKFAAEARRLDDSPAMLASLVRGALQAGQARPVHLDWAKQAGEQGEATDLLVRDVKAALEKAQAK